MAIKRLSVAGILAGVLALTAMSFTIPADKLDRQKIFYGSANEFTSPAEVDWNGVIKATPEYKEIKDQKIPRETGKYWILISKASDRAVRAIAKVGKETEHDLIALEGYIPSLELADVPAPANVTEEVIEALVEREKPKTTLFESKKRRS